MHLIGVALTVNSSCIWVHRSERVKCLFASVPGTQASFKGNWNSRHIHRYIASRGEILFKSMTEKKARNRWKSGGRALRVASQQLIVSQINPTTLSATLRWQSIVHVYRLFAPRTRCVPRANNVAGTECGCLFFVAAFLIRIVPSCAKNDGSPTDRGLKLDAKLSLRSETANFSFFIKSDRSRIETDSP